jgi:hypothetical protein
MKQLIMVMHACHYSYTGHINMGIRLMVQAKNVTLPEKQLKQKGLGAWLKWESTQNSVMKKKFLTSFLVVFP